VLTTTGQSIALDDPENIMLTYLLLSKNYSKLVGTMVYKYIEVPSSKINPVGKKDLASLLAVLKHYDYPNKENMKTLNEHLSSAKYKISLLIMCLFAFIFYVYDKSFLPADCPRNLHKVDAWLSSDILQYVNNHAQPFVHKEMIGYAVSEEGAAFFDSLLNDILIPLLKYNESSQQYFMNESLIEYYCQLALLIDTVQKTGMSSIPHATVALCNYPSESILKVVMHLISSYDQKEVKKYFCKFSKAILQQTKKDIRESSAILLNSNWSEESAICLISSSITEADMPTLIPQLCQILLSKSESNTSLQPICVGVLKKCLATYSSAIDWLNNSDIFSPLRSINFMDEKNKDKSILYDYSNPYLTSVLKSKLTFEQVEASVYALRTLVNMQSKEFMNMCLEIINPLFKLYTIKGNFVVPISKEVEQIIIKVLSSAENPTDAFIALFDEPLIGYMNDLAIIASINKNELPIVKTVSSEDIKEMQTGGAKSRNPSKSTRHNALDYISLEEYWNTPVKLSYEIECLSNGKLNFKHTMNTLQIHLLQYFSDQSVLELWFSQHENLFTIIMKLPNAMQATLLAKLFKKYLKQMCSEICGSENWKQPLQSKTRFSFIQNLDSNIESFSKCRDEIAKSVIGKIFSHFNIQYLEGIDEYKDILKAMISHDDVATVEKGLDIIHSFFKNIDNMDNKLNDFIISIFINILELTVQENQRLEEMACSLKEIIYHLFDQNISKLITPCKDQLINFFLKEFSRGDTSLSAYMLHEIGVLLKSCNESCPFAFEDIKSIWKLIGSDVYRMENSLESLLEIAVYFPDNFMELACNTMIQLKSDEEAMAYFIEMMTIVSKEKRIVFKNYQAIDMCIVCLRKALAANAGANIRVSIYEVISEFVKTLGINIGNAVNTIKDFCNNECLEDARGCALVLWSILFSWPIESILEHVGTINEALSCLQKNDDNGVKELCMKCNDIMQNNDMNK
jgi:hypothetical protein